MHFKPLHYRRYVDDSFVVFRSRDHIIPFLEYLNSKHPNIKFTYEIEKDHCLPFLDVNIMFSNGIFSTSVYRKPTFTGLFTNFDSFIPISYKRGLINTLLFRYFNISSSYAIFHAEVEKFKKIMNLNGYPEKFFDRIVRSFLNKIFEKPSSTSEPIEPKGLFFSRFLFQPYIPFKFEIKLTNYFPRLIHIFKFVAFFDLCKDFRLFSALKTAFL